VRATTDAPPQTGADTAVVGIFESERIAHDTSGGALQALVDSGEARPAYRRLALTHADGLRWILVGLGARDAFAPERARVAAALAFVRAKEVGARVLCWEVPHGFDADAAGALVEGTVLASYEFRAFKGSVDDDDEPARMQELVLSAHDDLAPLATAAATVAEAANAARDLQNTPGNHMTPTALAERAQALAAELPELTVEVWDRERIVADGMGAFAAVAQGSDTEPRMIVMRYAPAAASGPLLGLVGKAVTFDSGGISIKPALKMSEMKFDMSGGAAVLEATGAIARLGLPVRLLSVIGATENLPSGRAVKPGDIVRARTGTTIEIINTDAEGRLVLCDCLAYAVEQGADRLVDLATLTGGIITTFGSVFAGIMSNDDAWCAAVTEAGARTGERLWRLPLDPEYADMIKGAYGDIVNAVENRKAHSLQGAEFLHRFVAGVPWAHLDIAGVSDDLGRPYAAKGGSGFGVRLLVALARSLD
jgi:leucyl aminopeptidase